MTSLLQPLPATRESKVPLPPQTKACCPQLAAKPRSPTWIEELAPTSLVRGTQELSTGAKGACCVQPTVHRVEISGKVGAWGERLRAPSRDLLLATLEQEHHALGLRCHMPLSPGPAPLGALSPDLKEPEGAETSAFPQGAHRPRMRGESQGPAGPQESVFKSTGQGLWFS